eukprot:Skav206055  [mRNA]  locus=scaffold587:320020:321123:- [translate_table: standard]
MTWSCNSCSHQNAANQDHCGGCRKHWAKVWTNGRSRRPSRHRPNSQNRPRKDAEKKEGKPKKEAPAPTSSKDVEPWSVIPTNVPWIPTTPQSRIPMPRDKEEVEQPALPLHPPPPVLPAPPSGPSPSQVEGPMESLTEQEAQLLVHLRGLQKLGALPESLQEHYAQLEQRQQSAASVKMLSHSHLNRLNRVRGQVQGLAKKLSNVDIEWKSFLKEIVSKVHLHSEHYQRHRSDLLESYNKKLAELEDIKKELSEASQNLVGQVTSPDIALDDVALQAELYQFHQLTQSLTTTQDIPVQILEDDMDEDLEEVTPNSEDDKQPRKSHIQPVAFRSPGSPGKVAQNHLKNKATDKGKEKSREAPRKPAAE